VSKDINKFKKFLVKAKINTYALSGESGERKLPDEAKELEFIEGSFKYRDRYFGYNPFIGQEIVFQNRRPVWGMNYYGKIISEFILPQQIYQFLKEALRKATEDKLFRGPEIYNKEDFEYNNEIEGTLAKFTGYEQIFYKKQKVYQLNYCGRFIQEK